MTPIFRRFSRRMAGLGLVLSLAATLGAGRAAGQAVGQSPEAPTRQSLPPDRANAWETRNDLMQILQEHPPEVGQVLRLDPSLLTQPSYLATYPRLEAFLARHPEIPRNPSFFFGGIRGPEFGPSNRGAIGLWEDVMFGAFVLTGFLAFFAAVAWVARSVIEHRRWSRASRVQVDAHTKLLDRFGSNEDLLAYIQTPAGRRFLESGPMPLEAGPRAIGAPTGRILWSVQAGIVLATAGLGMQFVSGRVVEDVGQGFYVIGVVIFSLGLGFVLSSAVAFVLSRRLGLLEPGGLHGGSEPTMPSSPSS